MNKTRQMNSDLNYDLDARGTPVSKQKISMLKLKQNSKFLANDSRFSNTNVLLSKTPGDVEWTEDADGVVDERKMMNTNVDQQKLQNAFISTQFAPGSSFAL